MDQGTDPPGAGEEPSDSSIDEQFARLVEGLDTDGGPVTGPGAKEESARTRRLRAQRANRPPEAVAWRDAAPSTDRRRAGPDRRAGEGHIGDDGFDPFDGLRRTGRRGRALRIGPALLLIAALGAFWTARTEHQNSSVAGTTRSTATPQAAGRPSPGQSFANPDDAYFVGSPALSWADNEAGFTIPHATTLNGVSSSRIADGYRLLEDVLAAADLDGTILRGGPVTDYTNLLDPGNDVAREISAWLAAPGFHSDPTQMVTRFNPASTRLLGGTVKVSGSMSATADHGLGLVYLTGTYIFVYAVGPASAGNTTQSRSRVIVHRTVQLDVVDPTKYQIASGKAWITQFSASIANDQCFVYNGFINPSFGRPEPDESGTIDPYSSAQPTPVDTPGCQADSRV